MIMRLAAIALVIASLFVPLAQCSEASEAPGAEKMTFAGHIRPFLTTYCVSCHGADKQKGDRRLDQLPEAIADDDARVDWQDVVDQLNLGEMPPKEARQPSSDERRRVTRWLTDRIEDFHRRHRPLPGQTVLRRLNAREYRNSIRDLLQLNMSMFDPTVGFPRDQTADHLDNVGEVLVTSGHLLERYLTAADRTMDKVLVPSQQPTVQTWTFRKGFRQQPEIDQVHGKTNGFSRITLYDVVGADKPEGAYAPIAGFHEGVPHDGFYELRFRAEAVNRLHPYDREFIGTDPHEPLRLGIVAGNVRAGLLYKPQPIEPLLAEMELADEPKWYSTRIWLDAGFTPRFTFRNGLMDVRNLWGQLVKRYPEQFPKPVRGGIVEHRFYAIQHGKLPQIHIHEVEITGPHFDAWPTLSQRAVLGDDWETLVAAETLPEEAVRRQLTRFASQAYRRPAHREEIERLVQLVQQRCRAGRNPLEAYGDALKAVLCTPAFLYLDESADQPLSSSALASRLSYFLWSSMPDQELLDLAASDALQQPPILRAQLERMLQDPRAAVVDTLLDNGFTLRDLGSMPPDRDKFRHYYRYDLQAAMREETRRFTQHLLDENLSVVHFLDADFTYVNKPLARLYGLPPPAGAGFERVALQDRRRGGLLGQASVLTVTANGIDTSPIVRGVWLLENILGTPPSPPPPDVPPLDPDVRGAKSIRDQLEKHRTVSNCYDCHRKIDPLGFALEHFDAIGRWRDTYGGRVPIDASGELPSGQTFADVQGLKTILVERREQFVAALTAKLLASATGRRMGPADRPEISRIVAALNQRGNGLRDLLELIVTSETFRSP